MCYYFGGKEALCDAAVAHLVDRSRGFWVNAATSRPRVAGGTPNKPVTVHALSDVKERGILRNNGWAPIMEN